MPQVIDLRKGTIETVVVPIKDLLGNTSTLDTASPTYSLYKDYGDRDVVSGMEDVAASNDDMDLYCLIDATTLDTEDYRLYVKFTAFPETPRLLACIIRVND